MGCPWRGCAEGRGLKLTWVPTVFCVLVVDNVELSFWNVTRGTALGFIRLGGAALMGPGVDVPWPPSSGGSC